MNASFLTIIAVALALLIGGCAESTNGRAARENVAGARADVATIRTRANAASSDAKDLQSATTNLRRLIQ